ncbi:MAG TPA: AAA family ATPase [bacterium]|nr:AAA family ATPase [bacterium]HOL46961.1 AAA family ATPase [bacterium]HPQ18226.1 AAA family ATPase [bacterium]
MGKIIGFIGKGGTGKTTLTSLFLKYILQKKIAPILVIDADPNNCLADLLNLKIDLTIGDIKDRLMKEKDKLNKTTISKYEYFNYAINNAIVETDNFDLITMGKSEGPGCYCYINNLVKEIIEKLKKKYSLILIDCEAGLEHISRKTISQPDYAFIISDVSYKGILTAYKQISLMNELNIKTAKNFLIVNRVNENNEYIKHIKENDNLIFAGSIRFDNQILDFELSQKSLLNISDNSPAFSDFKNILDKLNLTFV